MSIPGAVFVQLLCQREGQTFNLLSIELSPEEACLVSDKIRDKAKEAITQNGQTPESKR